MIWLLQLQQRLKFFVTNINQDPTWSRCDTGPDLQGNIIGNKSNLFCLLSKCQSSLKILFGLSLAIRLSLLVPWRLQTRPRLLSLPLVSASVLSPSWVINVASQIVFSRLCMSKKSSKHTPLAAEEGTGHVWVCGRFTVPDFCLQRSWLQKNFAIKAFPGLIERAEPGAAGPRPCFQFLSALLRLRVKFTLSSTWVSKGRRYLRPCTLWEDSRDFSPYALCVWVGVCSISLYISLFFKI